MLLHSLHKLCITSAIVALGGVMTSAAATERAVVPSTVATVHGSLLYSLAEPQSADVVRQSPPLQMAAWCYYDKDGYLIDIDCE